MNISIKFQSHQEQRYDTTGDWYFEENGDLSIRVSNDTDFAQGEDQLFLVALHELVEAYLCKKRGITQQMIDDFDMGDGSTDRIPDVEESGDQEQAPYRKEHRFAMLMEHLMAHELGLVGWGTVR